MKTKNKIGKGRKIIGNVLLIICIVLIVYFATVMAYRLATVIDAKKWSVTRRFLAEFGIMCVIILPAVDIRFGIFSWRKNRGLKVAGIIVRCLSCAVCALFVALGAAVVITGMQTDDQPVKNVCVLGLAIEEEDIAPDLARRLDRALEYKKDHPDIPFIVTGGNSEDPYYSEAGYMQRYLIEHGFDTNAGPLILESNAKTTVENFRYVSETVDKKDPLGVITSDLHMFRATHIAKKQGYTSIVRIPAPSSPLTYVENVMWEVTCAFPQILGGEIAL